MAMPLGRKVIAGGALAVLNLVLWVAGLAALATGQLSGVVGFLVFGVVIVAVGASSLGAARVILER